MVNGNMHQSILKDKKVKESSELTSSHSEEQSEHCQEVDDVNVDYLLENYVGACGLWQWMVAALSLLSEPSMSVFPVFANAVPDFRCQMEPTVEKSFSIYGLSFEQAKKIITPQQTGPDETWQGCTRLQINWTDSTIVNQMIASYLESNTSDFRNFTDVNTEACPFGYVYQSRPFQYTSTIVADFDLVCGAAWIPSFGVFLFMIGTFLGYIIGGWFGDKYGRKPTAIGFSITELIAAVIISTATNQYIYHAGRTLIGITFAGKASVLRLLPIELTVAKYRGYFSSFFTLGVSFFHQSIMALAAYLMPQWRWLNAICLMPGLFCLTFFCLLPESPRWYNSKRQHKEAIQVLQRGMRINHHCSKSQPDTEGLQTLLRKYSHSQFEPTTVRGCSGKINMTRRADAWWKCGKKNMPSGKLLKRLTIGMSLYFLQILAHYGLLLYARVVHASVYLVVFLNSTSAIPGPVIASVVYRVFRYRRNPLIVCYLIIVCALLIGGLYPVISLSDSDVILNVCCNCALIMYSASYIMLTIYVAELFPSDFRTRALGLSTGVGRLGGSLCTFLNLLDSHVRHGLPVLIYAGSALLQLSLLFFIPDTTGENLPDVEQGEVKQEQTV